MEQERNDGQIQPPPPPHNHPHLNCLRCNSSNTKFCYYNNYSLSQPRYFCRACRRYWTHGGTLRNVPIGGGCRRNRNMLRTSPTATIISSGQPTRPLPPPSMMGNTFYGGTTFFPSIAAMQPPNQFGVNMSLLQVMSLQSLKPPGQFQVQGNLFPAHENVMNHAIGPWDHQNSGVGPSFMDQAGPSFTALNQGLGDKHPGFNPSSQ